MREPQALPVSNKETETEAYGKEWAWEGKPGGLINLFKA